MLEEFPNSSKIQTPSQLGIAATSQLLTVPWTTVKMSTGFSTRKMRRGAARSSSSAVPRTTAQRSTSRSSQSTVPRTTVRTSTLSAEQQRLREVAACLPMWYSYGNEHPVQLLHPRVTTLREEHRPESNASSPGHSDDNASSSTFLPKVPSSTRRLSVPPSTGPLHQNTIELLVHTSCYCVSDLLCVIPTPYVVADGK